MRPSIAGDDDQLDPDTQIYGIYHRPISALFRTVPLRVGG